MKLKMPPIPRSQTRRVVVKAHANHFGIADPARRWQPSKKQSKQLKQKGKA